MRGVKKSHLLEKNCTVRGRPLVWRRKWAFCWIEVRHRGEQCRHRPFGSRPVGDSARRAMTVEPAVAL
ncbi:MAG: DUF2256 domain-containing protein [Candidatus Competibacteraceae bacterium]|nr:MAG: DUF2256 domain-containing protein [Candidatus Competibacteraceae bacterium]